MDGISDCDETGTYYECIPQRASISKAEKMAQIRGYKRSRNSGVQRQSPTEDDEPVTHSWCYNFLSNFRYTSSTASQSLPSHNPANVHATR